jgi:hypothetical protein
MPTIHNAVSSFEVLDSTDTFGSKAETPAKGSKDSLLKEPLRLRGALKCFRSFEVGPAIGTEFPEASLTNWMKALNSNDLLRDLAITSKF